MPAAAVIQRVGGFLPEVFTQFRTCQNHFVYLLLILHHNAVDHIPVQDALLVKLPHALGLRERRGRLLAFNGNGNIPLVLGFDVGQLHRRSEFDLSGIHHFLQIRYKVHKY